MPSEATVGNSLVSQITLTSLLLTGIFFQDRFVDYSFFCCLAFAFFVAPPSAIHVNIYKHLPNHSLVCGSLPPLTAFLRGFFAEACPRLARDGRRRGSARSVS